MMKLFLGILLLSLGAIGLYTTTALPTIDLTSQHDLFQIMLIEVKRNRLITSAFILIAGLVLLTDHIKSK